MAKPKFFKRARTFTAREVSQMFDGDLIGQPELVLEDLESLDKAGGNDLTFFSDQRLKETLAASKAGACLIKPEDKDLAPRYMTLILVSDPYRAYAKLSQLYYPMDKGDGKVSPDAFVASSAKIGENTTVMPTAYIGNYVSIGKNCLVEPGVVIKDDVIIGDNCIVRAGSSIECATIGNDVHIYPGCRIGQDGFGFAMGPKGHVKIMQLGTVVIEDDVEIGANVTIDRGTLGENTIIRTGVRIDNLVMVAHNVEVGAYSVLVSQVGIAGSTKLGKFVIAAGQAGIAGHVKIGDGAILGAQSGILSDIAPGVSVMGSPAQPKNEHLRQLITLRKMAKKTEGKK